VQIARSAFSAPVTVPLKNDVSTAQRQAVSRVGGPDLQGPLPERGAFVGGNGLVEPADRETKVAAQATGVIAKLYVKEGDQVEAGSLLVQLNNEVELALLQAAEADLAAERANRLRTRKGLREEDRDAATAEAQSAQARSELSSGVAARIEQVAKAGAATKDELDRARQQAQADAANYRVAVARLRAAKAGSRLEDISFQAARVLSAEAKVAQAKAALARLAIRAPISGEILQVKVREGELYSVQGAEPLLIMGDTSKLRVRMDVDERDIAAVQKGADAYVTADAFGARKFAGKVVELSHRFGRKNIRTDDPVEKNDTKILEVLIELHSNQLLVPGQRVMSFISIPRTS
jgi:HlyD family secretion protein